MSSIEERIVAISFENAKFEAGVAKTMATLAKLDQTLKTVGATTGLSQIQSAADKLNFKNVQANADGLKGTFSSVSSTASTALGALKDKFSPLGTAIDAVKGKFSTVSGAASTALSTMKDKFAPLGTAIETIRTKFGTISTAASSALGTLKNKLQLVGGENGFIRIKKASDGVNFQPVDKQIQGVKTELGTLGGTNAFSGMENAANRVNFRGLSSGISSVSGQFSKMSIVATTALATIANKATQTGLSIIKSFTITPVKEGFQSYETQINAIQTILANTGLKGKKGIGQVNAALAELQTYANKTVYNFSEMARNIGTFTAAGVKLKPATQAIKGIANLAALSGSNSQQASTAMYQLSQAIAAGRVNLQDWNSVVNAGLGGQVFQKALARTAVASGKLKDNAVEMDKATGSLKISGESFRQSISAKPGAQSWLTSDVLTKTLAQFTGDLSVAQLKAQGFNASQIKQIQEIGKTANNAATKIKTFSQLTQALKEEVATAYGTIFKTIFGNIGQATTLFSAVHTAVENALTNPLYAFNKLLEQANKLGARAHFIDGLKNAMQDLKALIQPLKDAFHEIFPPATAKSIADFAKKFDDLTKKLKIGPETANNLKDTFKGFFAILDLGKQVIFGAIGMLGKLFGAAGKGSGGLLSLTGGIGNFLTNVDQAVKKGGYLTKFFDGLGKVLAFPIKLLGDLGSAISGLFSEGNSSDGFQKSVGGITKTLSPLAQVANAAKTALHALFGVLSKVGATLAPVVKDIAGVFGTVGTQIADAITHADMSGVFAAINTTLIGGIFLTLKKALGGGVKNNFQIDVFGGLSKNMSQSLGIMNKSLGALQSNIKANTLLQIATAVAVLAAAVKVLGSIDPKRLTSAMTGIAVGMGELIGAMKLITTGIGFTGFAKMPFISASLIGLAGAVDVLALAVKIFSKMDWESLGRGLAGIGGSLGALTLGLKYMNPETLGPTALAIIPIAIGLNILAGAVALMGRMDLKTIGKGLLGIGGGLAVIGLSTAEMGPEVLLAAAAIIPVAIGLTIMAKAIKMMGSLDMKTLAKGIGGIGATLVVLAAGLTLMTLSGPGAIALVAASIGLTALSGAVRLMGSMDTKVIAKGIVAIAGSLVVLAAGLTLMIASAPGAVALLAAAAAFAVLAPVITLLGNLKWSTIGKGLATIAATLLVIGAGGTLAAPGLLAISVALLAIGGGLAVAGLGVNQLAKGMALLGTSGAKGVAVLSATLVGLAVAIPKMITEWVKGVASILSSIANLAPQMAQAMIKIIANLALVITQAAPNIATAVVALIAAFLQVLDAKAPAIITSGWNLLIALLKGIKDHIGDVVTTGITIITNLLSALARNIPKLIAQGAAALIKFLEGIASNLPDVLRSATNVVVKFIEGVTAAIPKIVPAAAKMISQFVSSVASHVDEVISAGAKLIAHVLTGIGNHVGEVATAAADMVGKFFNAAVKAAVRLENAGAKAVINFMNGTADAIRANSKELGAAGENIASALVEGMVIGMAGAAGKLYDKAREIMHKALGILKKIPLINSPSKKTMEIGAGLSEGLAKGMDDTQHLVHGSAADLALSTIQKFRDIFEINSPSKVMRSIGKFVAQGFAQGLADGNKDDVDSAISALQSKITDGMTSLRDTISSENAHLKELRDARKPDLVEIAKAKDAMESNKKALGNLKSAHTLLTDGLKKQKSEMYDLIKNYQDITDKLDKANQALEDAKKTRDDAVASFTDQYSTLPDITPNTTDENGVVTTSLTAYQLALQNQANAVAAYQATLDRLRALGLDDATYQKLLKDGTADTEFANQLLAGGQTAIQGLTILDNQLNSSAKVLAQHAGTSLYQAGVDAAKGLVTGLISQQATIIAQMEALAVTMISAIKKKLHIKSPSRVFAEIGEFSMLGLAQGLADKANVVGNMAAKIGDNFVTSIQNSVDRISDILPDTFNMEPTITPVLDLSSVEKSAKQLSDITNVTPITAAASFGQALAISATQQQQNEQTISDTSTPQTVQEIKFEQNISSPEALSPTEVYRQTKNQLSQAKSLLGIAS